MVLGSLHDGQEKSIIPLDRAARELVGEPTVSVDLSVKMVSALVRFAIFTVNEKLRPITVELGSFDNTNFNVDW